MRAKDWLSSTGFSFLAVGACLYLQLVGRPEGRRYVDGFAYVKIEARILARAQCGKVSRFVLFAADIPSIVEPICAGALAGKRPLAGSAGLGETRAFIRLAVCESRYSIKDFPDPCQRLGH
jgi:hypothetical protein